MIGNLSYVIGLILFVLFIISMVSVWVFWPKEEYASSQEPDRE